jgi:hypothetical protein
MRILQIYLLSIFIFFLSIHFCRTLNSSCKINLRNCSFVHSNWAKFNIKITGLWSFEFCDKWGNISYVCWMGSHSTYVTDCHLFKPSSFVPFLILESFPLCCWPADENFSNLCSYIYVTYPITTCPSHRFKQLVCEADCSHLVQGLRMKGAVPLLSHASLWYAGQLYLYPILLPPS